jgi:Tol biopolymer transport system component
LRSETGIYQLDIERHRLRFLFPGARIVPSPNRRQVAYLTSENRFRGFHNILVYDVASERSLRVLSLWEADPGSGTSFSYRWSYDSKALLITGRAGGWASHSDHATELQLVYFPDAEQLFDLAPRRN